MHFSEIPARGFIRDAIHQTLAVNKMIQDSHIRLTLTRGEKITSGMDPRLASFFKAYLAGEKVIRFGDQAVINTHFPPYPSAGFDTMIKQFCELGQASAARHLYSVTLAVTNQYPYNC